MHRRVGDYKKLKGTLTITNTKKVMPLFLFLLFLPLFNAKSEAVQPDSTKTCAKFQWLPGAARSLSRMESASVDIPVFGYHYGPTAKGTLAGEWGWLRIENSSLIFILGMYSMVELQNHSIKRFLYPHQLWRGLAGISFSVFWGSENLPAIQGNSYFELTLIAGHESDHGDYIETLQKAIPNGGGGNFIAPDCTYKYQIDRYNDFLGRIACKFYITGALKYVPQVDITLRNQYSPALYFLLSLYYEYLIPQGNSKEGSLSRALYGVQIPGILGKIFLFGSLEYGNGKGLLINQRQKRIGAGFRYDPFVKP